jgi:hypothetical protein
LKKILLLLLLSSILISCSKGFKPEEVKTIENDIKQKYESSGWQNVDVSLVKDSDFHLTGFVKGTSTNLSTFDTSLYEGTYGRSAPRYSKTANCTATKDMDTSKYVWSCK